MLQSAESSFASTSSTTQANTTTTTKTIQNETSRRRSTFYVPLTTVLPSASTVANKENIDGSTDKLYNPDLSAYSFEWSLNCSDIQTVSTDGGLTVSINSSSTSNTSKKSTKRYGIVMDGDNSASTNSATSSTPIRIVKSHSRSNIINFVNGGSSGNISKPEIISAAPSPVKEKSKTLPQNMSLINAFPPKNSFLLKSTPKISLNYSSEFNNNNNNNRSSDSATHTTPSPRKTSLNFIRRAHSTKITRNNSLLKTLTSKCVDHSLESVNITVCELPFDRLVKNWDTDQYSEFIKDLFLSKLSSSDDDFCVNSSFINNNSSRSSSNNVCDKKRSGKNCRSNKDADDDDDENGAHSDTSYEKACRRGSAPATPILGQKNTNEQQSTSRFTNFFSKRSFRSNPLKRTKSVTKLERTKRGPGGGLRGSRSHESLLSSHAVMSTIDLSCTGAVGVAPVHQSVLGRRHCFQVRGGPRGERYYSCGSRQERDIWIYSLRKSIAPNAEHTRRTDNSLRMWIYEAKALPPKKKYFCEINLDKTLYGRTSVKLRSDLLFWGEYFDFPDIPEINVIHVNVFREGDKKKKRDKHTLVGSVKIPIHDVTSRATSEDWYPIVSEKHDSISRNSTKEPIPTLRIKCRFQSIDILPIEVYNEFLVYLKDNYKKVCEILEPVIGVKAKEDIGQALVLLMHAQGMAAAFLTDVVALDLLRVGDQRLTFRGNSLATKSMEAFLKLTGEQYLQDTLSTPISEIIASDRDCEVDPLKATGSLSRQQQALRNAVKISWSSIAESHKLFPPQLRDCFATFRERLQMLDREDMADNLISASIFLRFLCPAILSPSLFNITSELPSGRATRNLTLVAKTLQTLANFTRFQGKENFMEFLNDFLEQEATKMKEFLHLISTRDEHHPMQESIMDWSGYIDQGKQLSILHSLLSEAIQKLPVIRQQDLGSLINILDDITKAKESNNFDQHSNMIASTNGIGGGGEQHITNQHQPRLERGIMRGVLTPSSLEKNIFRYNDPTVAAQLQHSHSASSITASLSNHNMNHTSNSTNNLIPNPPTVYNGGDKRYLTNSSNSSSYYNASTISSNDRNSPAMSQNGIRASTLPRNNNTSTSSTNGISTVEIRNNKEEINSNLIQIGLDPSNAFLRKSPTPLMKSASNRGMINRGLNGSQISLLNERPIIPQHQSSSLLNLGIPHNQVETISNMPMNLEDLEDLIKYADEQNELLKNKDNITISNGKGSNISIGVCSSGYQSITTQSQSSSPIEQTNCLSVVNNNHQPNQSRMNALTNGKYQYIKYPSTSSSSTNSNSIIIPTNNNNGPLIHQPYKTPLYHVQSQNHSNNNHSSLTPSSSDENLGHDIGFDHMMSSGIHHNHHGLSTSLKTNGFSSRIPRTNPMAHYKRSGSNSNSINNNSPNADNELPIEINSYVSPPVSHHPLRYHRRLSLESARTLSDSSTDTEGHLCPADTICHSNTIESGKRRRATNGAGTGLLNSINGGGHHRGGGVSSSGHHSDRSVEQCERQIERLQASVDSLRHKLEESDLRESNDDLMTLPPHSDSKMRSIISRLISMEEELRREQLKMSLALTHKQRVIEAQVQQIAALDAANNRLLTALSSLRKRYETQQANNLSNQQQQQSSPQQQSPQQQQQQQPANAGGSSC